MSCVSDLVSVAITCVRCHVISIILISFVVFFYYSQLVTVVKWSVIIIPFSVLERHLFIITLNVMLVTYYC